MYCLIKIFFFTQFDDISEECVTEYLKVLPVERRDKAVRYRSSIDRKLSVIAFLLLQYALRQEFSITNPQIAFGEFGKPYLPDFPHIHFNLSHCEKGCVCAIADCGVGVDINNIRPYKADIAQKVCCENELGVIEHSDDKARAFSIMWAIKESYVKMLGIGIGYGLQKVDTTSLHNIEVIENDGFIISISIDF